MNVYIFLTLVLVISILFSLNKKNISEGFRNERPKRCVSGRYSKSKPCTQWVSKWGYCGNTNAHKKGGTDCRINRKQKAKKYLKMKNRMLKVKRQTSKAYKAYNLSKKKSEHPMTIARKKRWFRNRRKTYFILKRQFLLYARDYHKDIMLRAKSQIIRAERNLKKLLRRRGTSSKQITGLQNWLRNRRYTYNVNNKFYNRALRDLKKINRRRRFQLFVKKKLNNLRRRMISYKECPKNCAKPTVVGGNCVAGNPIETKDDKGNVKYYKKCSYHCLGPNDKGYENIQVGARERYHPKKHGCRYTSQCGQCGDLRVRGKSKWYSLVQVFGKFVEQDKGGVKKRYFVEDKNQKLNEAKVRKLEELERNMVKLVLQKMIKKQKIV